MRYLALFFFAATLLAQGPPPHGEPGGRGRPPEHSQPMDMSGKWWMNPSVIRRLGLTNDQQRAIEDIFQQNRIHLIDLTASMEKEEATLDPLLSAEHPQETAVFAQIDRVAEARAALEKANARMLYAFRMLLTRDQWRDLQQHR